MKSTLLIIFKSNIIRSFDVIIVDQSTVIIDYCVKLPKSVSIYLLSLLIIERAPVVGKGANM
jgi:hypothetical protein